MVGYLFSDIEDSTERWERAPQRMRLAVARQNAIIDDLVARYGGVVHDRAGDGVFAIFPLGNPLECALEIQLAMQREDWSAVGGLELRLGVHIGADGPTVDQASVNRAARIMGSGWGGQIVVSGEAIAAYAAPTDATFVDLGVCQFKGIDEPLRLSGLIHPLLEKREFPPLRSHHVQGVTIPRAAGPLFGRRRETAEIVAQLSQVRLLTIVGPGGNGKTRLAIEVASECARGRPVVFASLDSVAGGPELISAIAGALRYPFYGADPPEKQLIEYLRDRAMLVVLDNADGIAGRATMVEQLLGPCSQVTILATSREPLRVAGEVLYRLAGLPVSTVNADILESPAYQLFAFEARAQGVDRAFASEAQQFQKICEVVGGSPLALRLVAKWSRLLTFDEVLEQLCSGTSFLSDLGESQVQLTLAGVFEGSWKLLDACQQDALARLSVFAGPFDWNAAEQVAETDLATYRALADKSLLDQETGRKFKIHPLIRDYARRKLALIPSAEARTLRRHAEYYLDMVWSNVTECSPDVQRDAFGRLQDDFPNIRAAWEHGNAIRLQNVRSAILPLHEFLTKRSMINDGIALFSIEPNDPSVRTLIQGALAHNLFAHGAFEECEKLALRIFATRGEPTARALARDVFAGLAHVRGDYPSARRHYERAIVLWSTVGNAMRGSFSVISLALLHFAHGRAGEAAKWNKQAFRLSRQAGNSLGMLLAQMLAGDLALREGRPNAAMANYERALRLDAARDNLHMRASVLRRLGTLYLVMSDATSALRHHREALELAIESGERRSQSHALVEIGEDLRCLGDLGEARASLLEGIRLALALGVQPALTQGLIALGKLELVGGGRLHARRIAGVLAGMALGDQQGAYDTFVRDLGGALSLPSGDLPGIEEILEDITDDAELGAFE